MLNHLGQTSLIGWGVGLIGGGVLGLVCALLVRGTINLAPQLRTLIMLIPWRTAISNLLLFDLLVFSRRSLLINGLNVINSPWAFTLAESEWLAETVAIAGFIGLLAWVTVVLMLLDLWLPPKFGVRLVANIRTLTVTAIVVALAVNALSGNTAGIGGFIMRRIGLLDLGGAWEAWGRTLPLTLTADLGLGILQVVVARLR